MKNNIMQINENIIDRSKFDILSDHKYVREPLEFFKCTKCNIIVIGMPDCHIGFYDPANLKKTFSYNIPYKVKCPHCKNIWYDGYYQNTENISLDEFLSSQWKGLFSKK